MKTEIVLRVDCPSFKQAKTVSEWLDYYLENTQTDGESTMRGVSWHHNLVQRGEQKCRKKK